MNEIEIYKNNSKSIIITIDGLTSLSGYTVTLNVRKRLTDANIIITSTGDTIDLTSTFNLLPEDTNIDVGSYDYDIVASNETNNYTVMQSKLKIIDSVKYH